MNQQPEDSLFLRHFGCRPLVYLRKLGKRSDWKLDAPSPNAIFGDEPEISLFGVSSEIQFMQVAIGLNSRRNSLNEVIDFLTLFPAELQEFGIIPNQTPGEVDCECAISLHVDIRNSESDILKLVQHLALQRREVVRLSKGDMNRIIEKLAGCTAVKRNSGCTIGMTGVD